MALDLLKIVVKASYLPEGQKRNTLFKASEIIDYLKIFIRLGFDLKILNQKKYLARQGELQEIGRMVGAWIKKT
ncbi:four helix bundle protein [Patescibacteria group bacterium]